MDLKSVLADDDLFVSYWVADHLTVLIGTQREIVSAETRSVGTLHDLLSAFTDRMADQSQYWQFIRTRGRAESPAAPMKELVAELAAILVPPSLLRRCGTGVRRLIVFPDATLNVVPIHLFIESASGKPFYELFPGGVMYAPSASSYVYACTKRRKSPPTQAVILVGDGDDRRLLEEAERVRRAVGGPAEIVTKTSDLPIMREAALLYIATHGFAPAEIGGGSGGARPTGWGLLFDHGALGANDFFSERLRLAPGSVVVLSACSVGHLMAGAAHELDGLIQSIFYAGAATVLAARWPILYATADAVFARTIESMSQEHAAPARALNDALRDAMERPDLTAMMTGPDASTFFWGAFALFGSGD